MASAPAGPGMAAVPEVKVYYGKPIQLKPMHLEPMQLDVSRVLACLYEKDVKFKPIDMFQGKPMPDLIKLQVSTGVQVIGFEDGPIFLHDSRAICRYVAEKYADRGNKYLLGRDMLDRTSIEQWLNSEEQSFDPPSRELIFYIAFGPHTNNSAPDRALITQSERKLAKVLDIYEQRLSRSRYLAGDEFTLADLNHIPNSYYLATTGYRGYLFDKRTNVKRWWEDISDRPSWTKVAELMTKDTGVNVQKEPIAIEKDASKSRKPSIEVKKDVASREKTEKVFLVPPPTSFISLVSPSTDSAETRSDAPQDIAPTRPKKVPTSEQSTDVAPPTKETATTREANALEAPTGQAVKPPTQPSPAILSTESAKPRSDTPQDVAPTTPEKEPTSEQDTKIAPPTKEIAATREARVQPPLEAPTPQEAKPSTHPSPTTPSTKSVEPRSDAPQYVAPTIPKKVRTSEEATKVAPPTEKLAAAPEAIVQPALEVTTPHAAKRDTTRDVAPTTPEKEPISERYTKVAPPTKEIAAAREATVQPPLEVPTVQTTKPSAQPSPTAATESVERRSETPQDVAPTTPKKVPTFEQATKIAHSTKVGGQPSLESPAPQAAKPSTQPSPTTPSTESVKSRFDTPQDVAPATPEMVPTSEQTTKVSPPTKEIVAAREATVQPTLETPTPKAVKPSTQPSPITPAIENAKPRFDTPQDVAPTTPVNVPTSEQATKVAPPTKETVVAREAGKQPSLEAQTSEAAKPSTQPSSTTSTESVEPQSDTPQDIIPTPPENVPTSEQATKEAPFTKKTVVASETKLQPSLKAPTPQTAKPTQPSSTTLSTKSVEPRSETPQDVSPTTPKKVPTSEQDTKVAPPTKETDAALEARVQPALEAPTPQAAKLSRQPSPTTPLTKSVEPRSDTSQDVAPTTPEKVATYQQSTDVAPPTKETATARKASALEAPTGQAVKPPTQPSPAILSTESAKPRSDTPQDVAPTTPEKEPTSEQDTKIAPPTKEIAATRKARVQPPLEAPTPQEAKPSTYPSPTTPSTKSVEPRSDASQYVAPTIPKKVRTSEEATKVAPPTEKIAAAPEAIVQPALEATTPHTAKRDTTRDVAPTTPEKEPISERYTKVAPPTKEIAAAREATVQPPSEVPTVQTTKPSAQPSPTTATESVERRSETPQDVAPTTPKKVPTFEQATKIAHSTKVGGQPSLESPAPQAAKPSTQPSSTTPSTESVKSRFDTPQDVAPATPEMVPMSEQTTKVSPPTKEIAAAREATVQPTLETPTPQTAKPSTQPSPIAPSIKNAKPQFDTPQDVATTTPVNVPTSEQATKVAPPTKETVVAREAGKQPSLEAQTSEAVKPSTQPSSTTSTESAEPQSDTPQDIIPTPPENVPTSEQATKEAPFTKKTVVASETRLQPPLKAPTPQTAKPTQPSSTTLSTKSVEPRSDTPQDVSPITPKKVPTFEQDTKVAPPTKETDAALEARVQPALEAPIPQAAKLSRQPSPTTPLTKSVEPRSETSQDVAPTTPEKVATYQQSTDVAPPTKETATAREASALEAPTGQAVKPPTQPSPAILSTESAKPRSDTPQDVAPTTPEKEPTSEQDTKIAPPTKEIAATREARVQPPLKAPTPQEAKPSTHPSPTTPSTKSVEPRSDAPQYVALTIPKRVRTSEEATKVAPPTEKIVAAPKAIVQPALEATTPHAAKRDTTQDVAPTTPEKEPISERYTKVAPPTKEIVAAHEATVQPPLEVPTVQTTKPSAQPSQTAVTKSVERRSETPQDVAPTTPKKVPTFEQATKIAHSTKVGGQPSLESPTPQAAKPSTQPSPPTPSTESVKSRFDTPQDVAPATPEMVPMSEQTTKVSPPTKEIAATREATVQPTLETPTPQAAKPSTQPSPITPAIKNAKPRFDTPQDVAPTTPVKVPTSEQATKVAPPTKETVVPREAGKQPSLEAQTSEAAKPSTQPSSTTSTESVEPQSDTPQDIIPTPPENVPTSEQATKEAPFTKKTVVASETRLQPPLKAPTPQTAKPAQPSSTTLSTKSVEPRSDTPQDVSPTTPKKVHTSEQDTKVAPPTKETDAALEARVQPALEAPIPQAAKLSRQPSPTTLTKNVEPRSDTSQDVAPTTPEKVATYQQSTDVAPPTKETATAREASALEAPTGQAVKPPTQPSPAILSTESAKPRSDTPQDVAPTTPEKEPTSEQDTKIAPPTKEIAATREARVQPPLEAPTPQEAKPSTHPSPTTPSTKSVEPRSDAPQYIAPTIPKKVRTSEEATKVAPPTEKIAASPEAIIQPALEATTPHAAKRDTTRDVAPTTSEKEPISERYTKVAPPTKEIAAAREATAQPPLEVPTVQTTKPSAQPSPTTATESVERRSETPQDVAPITPKKVPTFEQATKIAHSTKVGGQPSLESSAPQAAKPSTQPLPTTQMTTITKYTDNTTTEQVQAQEKSTSSPPLTNESKGKSSLSQTTTEKKPSDMTVGKSAEAIVNFKESAQSTKQSSTQTTMRIESTDNTTPDKLTTKTTVSSQMIGRTEITDNTTTKQAQAPNKSKLPPPQTDESKAKSLAVSQPIVERQPSKEPISLDTQSNTQTSNNSERTTTALSSGKTTTEAIQNPSSIQNKEPTVSNGELSSYETSTSEMPKESLSTKKAHSQEAQKAEKSVASGMIGQTPSISETTGTRTQSGVANTTESTQSPNSNFGAKTDPSIDSDSKSDSPLQS